MKALLISFLFFVSVVNSFAQKGMLDVVYLKNGSRIQGTILQIYPDSIVQIRQTDGSVWVFSMKEISMIDKEIKQKTKAEISTKEGYQFGADAGFLIGSKSTSHRAPLSVHILNSYQFTKSMAAGIGAGLEFFGITQVPVYADLRYSLNKSSYSSYIFIQGGAMLPIGKENEYYPGFEYKGLPGFMVNPGIGFLFPLNERSAFSVSFSYRYHELYATSKIAGYTETTRIEVMNRFNLRIGFLLR